MDSRAADKQVLYASPRMTLELHQLRSAGGHKYKRDVVVSADAAVVLPILPDGRVMMIRNFRYPVNEHLLELPAGLIEPGESPMNCAGRELMEETGYVASKLTRLGSFYSSPGLMTEKVHAFVATDLLPHAGEKDPHEQIELSPMTMREALQQVLGGEIVDTKTIATLLLFEAKRKAGG